MALERFNVERVSHGTGLYLAYNPELCEMFWTTDPERDQPFTFDDLEEAEDAASEFGGEVFRFERLARPSDVVIGHNVTSRLERWSAATE